MLGTGDFNKIRGGFEQIVGLLGVPATWTQAKPPQATVTATVGFRHVGRNESEVINAFGIDTVAITVKATDFATAPEKFDQFAISGDRYTVQAVHPIHLNGTLIGYRALAKGK